MIWSEPFYFGSLCRKNGNGIRKKIENFQMHPCVFLVTLPQSEHAVLEIVPSLLLLQRNYPSETLTILGMGATRREAEHIVADLVTSTFQELGNCDVAAYIDRIGRKV